MLQFRELTLSDGPILRQYFGQDASRICDRTMGGAMMWRKHFRTEFCESEGCLIFQSEISPGKKAFSPPLGNWERGLDLLEEHCARTGVPLCFCSVPEEEKDRILIRFPQCEATESENWADYLYRVEDLRDFPGKKLAGQRNHRNFFLKQNHPWEFVPLTEENRALARAYFCEFSDEVQKESPYFAAEMKAVEEVLEHVDHYGFFGGMILIAGVPVALSLGECIGDTLFVHVEKASRAVRGSYPMMVSEFLRYYAVDGIRFVNREEDVGDPGLRYSKQSYHPIKLLNKYVVEERSFL